MDWLVDVMMGQWKEASKAEEEIAVKRSEDRRLQVEKVQRVPGFVVVQVQVEKTAANKENKRRHLSG